MASVTVTKIAAQRLRRAALYAARRAGLVRRLPWPSQGALLPEHLLRPLSADPLPRGSLPAGDPRQGSRDRVAGRERGEGHLMARGSLGDPSVREHACRRPALLRPVLRRPTGRRGLLYGPEYGENLGVWQRYGFEGKIICLSRGACLPWAPKGSGSRLIRRSMRLLPDGYEIVTATVDPTLGEVGIVYQAAGFLFAPMSRPGGRYRFPASPAEPFAGKGAPARRRSWRLVGRPAASTGRVATSPSAETLPRPTGRRSSTSSGPIRSGLPAPAPIEVREERAGRGCKAAPGSDPSRAKGTTARAGVRVTRDGDPDIGLNRGDLPRPFIHRRSRVFIRLIFDGLDLRRITH